MYAPRVDGIRNGITRDPNNGQGQNSALYTAFQASFSQNNVFCYVSSSPFSIQWVAHRAKPDAL
jgi:hypothetical protein